MSNLKIISILLISVVSIATTVVYADQALQHTTFELPFNTQFKECQRQYSPGTWALHWQQRLGDSPSSCRCQLGKTMVNITIPAHLNPVTADTAPRVCQQVCKATSPLEKKAHPQRKTCIIQGQQAHSSWKYPATHKGDLVETLHGVQVADPYRWLEDDQNKTQQTWVKNQSDFTQSFLKNLPHRDELYKQIESVWNYAKMNTPSLKGEQLFYRYNDGLQNQSVLYTRHIKQTHQQAQVLLDPNTLSKEGVVALKTTALSKDGRYLAYQFAKGGSDWVDIKIRDVANKKDLKDHLKWVKFSGISWLPDGSGFYYSRYDSPKKGEKLTGINYYQKLYFHRLNTDQGQDQLIYARSDEKEWGFDGHVSADGQFLIISVWQGASEKNQILYKRLRDAKGHSIESPVIPLIDHFRSSYRFLGHQKDVFWFQTDHQAKRGQIIAIPLQQADPSQYQVLVAEQKETIESAKVMAKRFVVGYLKDASNIMKLYHLNGRFDREIKLPGMGSQGMISGEEKDTNGYFTFTSFTDPKSVYYYDFVTHKVQKFFTPTLSIDSTQFMTKQVFIKSKDGTKIPAFIVHAKHLDLSKPHPTLLYGYGGFNISLTPYFKPDLLVWLQRGGIYVVATLRGGGEYGEAWHQAGMKDKKQNVFDDFISVAEWLIDTKMTRPDRLAIRGGSNGGLLVGACALQRPDLFAAAIPAVGVMDMLRFHKFTIGWAWMPEYGSPDKTEDFKTLYAYSPLHNLKEGTHYPATMTMTADHDDRVVPAHSFKYGARLQATHAGVEPVMIRIDRQAGHGAGTPTSKRIQASSDLWAFLTYTLKASQVDSTHKSTPVKGLSTPKNK